jgi:signal transduction histidine kinase
VGVALCGLAATVIGARFVSTRDARLIREGADAEARHVAGQLKVGLNQAFDPLQRIAAWWLIQGRPMAPEDWENDAQLFVSAKAGLRMIVWLDPKGTRSWTFRPGRFRAELGQVGVPDPALVTTVAAARSLKATAVSPVFDSEGKALVYVCVPIRRHARLIGYIAGLYDSAELIHSVLENQLSDRYAISVSANGHLFHAPAVPQAVRSVFERTAPVVVGNAIWSVTVTPATTGGSSLERSVMRFGVLASAFLYVCAAFARIARRRAKELQSINARLEFENQERRRAEEKVEQLNRDLQRKLQEFQTLVQVLPVGIAVAEDSGCRHIWTNPALATMLDVRLGQNISQSVPDGERPPYKILRNGNEVPPEELPMQVAARTKAPVTNDYLVIVRNDGTALHTLSYSAPLFDENGEVRGVLNSCVDITERKQLEDRLQQTEKYESLALMAGGIAHDFNNLLTVIIGNASCVATELPERSGAGRAIADLQSAAARAARLVAQLLAFTGQFWCEAKPIALSAEIERMASRIREIVPPAASIRYDLAADLPLIKAGAVELRQVVENLVSNAVEALDEDGSGTIEIRTSRCDLSEHDIQVFYPDRQLTPGAYVRLEIMDTGCGIPDEIAARVFDPFFTTKFLGRGLGLSAVLGIVRAHGGAIRLDSQLDRGTRVELIFPMHAPDLALHALATKVCA